MRISGTEPSSMILHFSKIYNESLPTSWIRIYPSEYGIKVIDIEKAVISFRLLIYTFVVSGAFMAGAASQAGDADSIRAPVSPLVCRGP